jgi:hypothetical protein
LWRASSGAHPCSTPGWWDQPTHWLQDG